MELRAYRVFGRVQRVGFREWTRRTAERLALSGTVRNLPDGSVEVRARGEAKALTELEGRLRKGPLAARVDSVERIPSAAGDPGDATPDSGFRIVS